VKNNHVDYYDLEGTTMYEDEVSMDELYKIEENQDKISVYRNRKPVWKN